MVHFAFALRPGHLPVFRCRNWRDAKRGRGRRHFYFVPRTDGDRCAGGGGQRHQHSRAVAWVGSQHRCVPKTAERAATLVGPIAADERCRRVGWRVAAAQDATTYLLHLVPWLLLGGTLLFAFGNTIRVMAGKTAVVDDLRKMSWQAITVTSMAELLVATYGGYFGAGIGFITLGMLAALGMRDIHAMGAIRTLLATVINAAAVLTFILAGAVFWPHCVVMIAGALVGGWFGAHYAQRADPRKVRRVVIAVGVAMSAYYFVTVR